MAHDPESLYRTKLEKYSAQIGRFKKQLLLSSMLRLLVFLVFAFGVYYFFGAIKPVVGIIAVGIVVFFILVARHNRLKLKKEKVERLLEINQLEVEVLNQNFSSIPSGKQYKNPEHEFSQDIDLFGERSFFQYINRTGLQNGEFQLAQNLKSNNLDGIESRQEAIAELSQIVDFRQEFSALAKMVDTETGSGAVIHFLQNFNHFVPKAARWLPLVFSLISVGVVVAFFTDFISWIPLTVWFGIGLAITAVISKKVSAVSGQIGKLQKIFQQYYQLLDLLDSQKFRAEWLVKKQNEIKAEKHSSGKILKEFSKTVDALEQRNVMLFGFLANGFLLWDWRYMFQIQKWMENYATTAQTWFAVVEEMDAFNSLGNFAFNHPNYIFPEIDREGQSILKTEGAVHPLIDSDQAVLNDFEIDKDQFFIITGANMAGKSTFLRTVSLQLIMANSGLPVCAKTCVYKPIKLITSMRTVDSLADEASYFYAELRRLKFVVEAIQDDNYFIILDEILKGTNSKDKAEGSQKFIEKLVASNATGLIATHDLSLCEMSDKLDEVENYYFDVVIQNDELYFDYLLKKGICQTMNASFLLRKMEIVDKAD
jgi:ABC-type multidrug transport system fused ATPase/permease subunit